MIDSAVTQHPSPIWWSLSLYRGDVEDYVLSISCEEADVVKRLWNLNPVFDSFRTCFHRLRMFLSTRGIFSQWCIALTCGQNGLLSLTFLELTLSFIRNSLMENLHYKKLDLNIVYKYQDTWSVYTTEVLSLRKVGKSLIRNIMTISGIIIYSDSQASIRSLEAIPSISRIRHSVLSRSFTDLAANDFSFIKKIVYH